MPSIKDVAKEAGVSPTTVSSVINGLDCVKPSTREKVLKAIEKLGYAPNIAARELVTRKKQNVGLILMTYEKYDSRRHTPDGGEEMMYGEYINGIARGIEASGYGLLIEYFCYIPGSRDLPRLVENKRVAGVIVAGSIYQEDFIGLLREHMDVVITIAYQSKLADYVVNDYVESMRAPVKFLIERGHKRIAYLSGDPITYAYPLKFRGYRQALEEAGIAFDEDYVIPSRYEASEGYRCAGVIAGLPQEKRPTAIMCAGDLLAAGVYRYFYEHNKRIPEDISVVGYENTNLSMHIYPRMTTVDWDKATMTENACRLLMERLEAPSNENRGVVVPFSIIDRESVKPLKH